MRDLTHWIRTCWTWTGLAVVGSAALAMASVSPALAADDRPPTFCNPVDLPYSFQPERPTYRVAADPAVVVYKGEYWLFATHGSGYWHSADCVHWQLVPHTSLPVGQDAPGVAVVHGKMYWTAIGTGIYESTNPATGTDWQLVDTHRSSGDPDLFVDDDGKVYMYWGCSDRAPIQGQQLDPDNGFKPVGRAKPLCNSDVAHHGAEVFAEATAMPPYKPGGCWLEGPWVTKHAGRYYLQCSTPATEFKTYNDSVWVSDHPLGPFTYAPYNPFSFKPSGFIAGAGHSTTFQDAGGRYWRMSSLTVSVRHKFERRLGLFPTWFAPDGQMVCDTSLGDYPQYVPGTVKDPSAGNRPDWALLTYGKPATASSTLDGHPVGMAFDEEIRDWWSARTGDPGEWLQVDMGKACRVDAIQVNFADEGAVARERIPAGDGYGYTLELSTDGKAWRTAIDRTTDRRDAPHDYVQLDQPVSARFARLTNAHVPAGAKFSVSGLRLFGSGLGPPPDVATGLRVERDPTDGRQAVISWDPVPAAQGYVVRYGLAKDSLFANYQVYGTSTLHIHSLDIGTPYFFAVDTLNDCGVTRGTATVGG